MHPLLWICIAGLLFSSGYHVKELVSPTTTIQDYQGNVDFSYSNSMDPLNDFIKVQMDLNFTATYSPEIISLDNVFCSFSIFDWDLDDEWIINNTVEYFEMYNESLMNRFCTYAVSGDLWNLTSQEQEPLNFTFAATISSSGLGYIFSAHLGDDNSRLELKRDKLISPEFLTEYPQFLSSDERRVVFIISLIGSFTIGFTYIYKKRAEHFKSRSGNWKEALDEL